MADEDLLRNDEGLVSRIRDGDEDALRAVIRLYGGRVRGWLGKRYGSVLHDGELDEAFSAAVTKVWRNADKFDSSRGSLGGWFLRIAQREVITILRREAAYRSSSLELTFDVSDDTQRGNPLESEEPARDSQYRVEALHEIISALPPKQKAIVLADLAAGGPANAARLALELRTSTNSIYVLRNRAHEQIRRTMRGMGYYLETQGHES